MSLPSRPWPIKKVHQLQKKALAVSYRAALSPVHWHRKAKRADRLAKRFADLACQTMDIDPHAPASFKTTGIGTRKPR